MRKPVVDYREFRLSRLREPRFSHLLWLWGWPVYFVLYLLTENLIPAENCTPVWCPLDDFIPFCEYFIIPYVFWYFLIVASLLWFAFYNPENFKNLQKFIIFTQLTAMAVYILFPTRQDLRPEFFLRDNVFTDLLGLIYTVDTSTGVCPSLHCAYSIGIASVCLKEERISRGAKIFVVAAVALICLSTMFVKQHSAVDFLAAIPQCILAEAVVFGKSHYRRKKAVS